MQLLFYLIIAQVVVAKTVDKDANSPSMLNAALELNLDEQSSQFLCINSSSYDRGVIINCTKEGPLLQFGYCATYDEETKLLSTTTCSYFQPNGYNVTIPGYILLPRNLSQLNDYMCGPLNRKGLVCSECADGFGPSVTSFGYKCANCTDAWYGVPLFLVVEFVPITVFYLIILVFQINMYVAPMPCFIMYAQCIVALLYLCVGDSTPHQILFAEEGRLRWDMKIIQTFYGVFNLDFFQLVLPIFCISSRISAIHLAVLGYISVVYPIILIFLTWVCIDLHGRNFRPLVWLWRPFHRCFVRLRRGWDTKSDIADVFATFIILSHGKCTYQTLMLYTSQAVRTYDKSGNLLISKRAAFDLSIPQLSTSYIILVLPASLLFMLYNVLPPLILFLYPFKVFRSCLSKCRLNFITVTVNFFVEKINSCYRDGLDGRKDMRSFSGLYFFPRIAAYLTGLISYKILNTSTVRKSSMSVIMFPIGTVFLINALTLASVKPYRTAYMNYVSTLLLANLALLCYLMTSEMPVLLIARVFLLVPIIAFIFRTIFLRIKFCKERTGLRSDEEMSWWPRKCSNCCHFYAARVSPQAPSVNIASAVDEHIPILPPSRLEIDYGTNDK